MKYIKRAGLTFFALMFSLMSSLNISAMGDEKTDDEPWLHTTAANGKGRIYCDEGAKSLFSALCSNSSEALSGTSSSDIVTVTMHVNRRIF